MTEHITTSAGDRVAFDHHLAADPTDDVVPVVFVAGAGPHRGSDQVTTETARLLADLGVPSVVHDRVGRGESPADAPIHLDRELAALAALIETAGGRAILCGHSSGCTIALAAAVGGLPVTALALWEAPLGQGAEPTRDWWARTAKQIAAGDREGALATYMEDMPAEFLEAAKAAPDYPATVAAVVSYGPDGESLVWAESQPLSVLLRDLDIPVVAAVGAETFPGMPEAADAIAAATDGRSIVVDGAWHSWEPRAMASVLADLARVTAEK
ncbi:alpha/beta hydrolase [Microbacterium sp. P05]|uniref:alpha/beta hydrolase n=1 Tax=Microbacterium sp. P05 TaxID=3366948 RepID=UPI0037454C89